MGVYTEYLNRQLGFEELAAERKAQLTRLSVARGGRDVLVYAADLNKGNAPISIRYDDLLPISDQLQNLTGSALDLILESPGGSGEVAEDIMRLLRDRYDDIAVVVVGYAKSAGTIMAMAADDITDWLTTYKFRKWSAHSDGRPVTEAERRKRAEEIADELCDHGRWLTHGRSLKISDLRAMRLTISDYSAQPAVADPLQRYYALMQMTFGTNCYKLFETPASQIYRFIATAGPPAPAAQAGDLAVVEFRCANCGQVSKVQANLGKRLPLQEGHVPFPADNRFKCPGCGTETDLGDARRQIEGQAKKPVVS